MNHMLVGCTHNTHMVAIPKTVVGDLLRKAVGDPLRPGPVP